MDRFNTIALLHDQMTKIRHSCIEIFAILTLLGPDNIYSCLQLSTLDSLENMVNPSAIVHSTVTMIYKALHYCVLFILECNRIVSISSLLLIIIVSCAAFFLLLQPAWPHDQDQEIAYEHQRTELDCPVYFLSVSCIHVCENL